MHLLREEIFSLGLVIDSKKGSEGGEGETVVFFRLNKRRCFFVWEEKKRRKKRQRFWLTRYIGGRVTFFTRE